MGEDCDYDAYVVVLALSCHVMTMKKLDAPRLSQMNLSGGDVDNDMAEATKT